MSSKHDISYSSNITSKTLSCPGSTYYKHLYFMIPQESQQLRINQGGFYLGVGAEAFLVKALVDSTNNNTKALIVETFLSDL